MDGRPEFRYMARLAGLVANLNWLYDISRLDSAAAHGGPDSHRWGSTRISFLIYWKGATEPGQTLRCSGQGSGTLFDTLHGTPTRQQPQSGPVCSGLDRGPRPGPRDPA